MPYKQTYDNYYREYFKSPAGRAARHRYNISEKGREAKRRERRKYQAKLKAKYRTSNYAEARRYHRLMLGIREKSNVSV